MKASWSQMFSYYLLIRSPDSSLYFPLTCLVVAASDGAKAAIEAERWLRLTYGNTGSSDGGHHPALIAEDVQARDEGEREARYDKFDDWSEDKDDKNPENCDLTTATCIGTVVSKHPVTVFSKPWCPFCRRAIEALALAGVDNPNIIDLSQMDAQGIQSTLQQMTGRRTVPNVFIGGKSIGGGDETVAYEQSGKLTKMLRAAGAIS